MMAFSKRPIALVYGFVVSAFFCLVTEPRPIKADDWPQWLGPRRDGVWREKGIIEKFPKKGPTVLWRKEIAAGYSGPAVADGRVYVTDHIRPTKLKDGGDKAPEPSEPEKERILCLDARNGDLLWKHEYDCKYARVGYSSGPRTTPVVEEGKVYTLGTMGDLLCLDALKGSLVWSKNLVKEYKTKVPVWGYSAHLLVDGDRLISLVGGDKSAVAAFDKKTGKELWRALSTEEIGYAPPAIYDAGGKRQLIVWLTESLNGLSPESGDVYWSEPYPTDGKPMRPAVTIMMPRKMKDLLFVSTYYHGPMMLKLDRDKPAASVLWKSKSANIEKQDPINVLIPTPFLKDGYIYGVGGVGDLCCLKADTGEKIWETFKATGGKKADFAAVFIVAQEDRFFLFNDQGDLIIAHMTPKGYEEISKAHLLDPLQSARGREIVWSHPAFANRCVFARNDKEIICVSLAAGADDKDAVKKDLAKFQGAWIFESIEVEGQMSPVDEFKGIKLVIKDDASFTMNDGDVVYKGTIKIDPAKKPKEIDVIFTEGPEKGTTMIGIYELDDTTYRPCFKLKGKDRPTEFTAKKGSGQVLEALKKVKQ
ncbi:MAG: PQQ-binding-like beta-propeller repeat protein [Gemmataceae bacterium]